MHMWILLLVLALTLAGCGSTGGVAENTEGIGVIQYSGQASPGIIGRPYVRGSLDVRGCRVNTTQKSVVLVWRDGSCAVEAGPESE